MLSLAFWWSLITAGGAVDAPADAGHDESDADDGSSSSSHSTCISGTASARDVGRLRMISEVGATPLGAARDASGSSSSLSTSGAGAPKHRSDHSFGLFAGGVAMCDNTNGADDDWATRESDNCIDHLLTANSGKMSIESYRQAPDHAFARAVIAERYGANQSSSR